jgi:hypothetical protein
MAAQALLVAKIGADGTPFADMMGPITRVYTEYGNMLACLAAFVNAIQVEGTHKVFTVHQTLLMLSDCIPEDLRPLFELPDR